MIIEKLGGLGLLAAVKALGMIGLLAPAAAFREPAEGASGPPAVSPAPDCAATVSMPPTARERWIAINIELGAASEAAARATELHHRAAAALDGADGDLAALRQMLPSAPTA